MYTRSINANLLMVERRRCTTATAVAVRSFVRRSWGLSERTGGRRGREKDRKRRRYHGAGPRDRKRAQARTRRDEATTTTFRGEFSTTVMAVGVRRSV